MRLAHLGEIITLVDERAEDGFCCELGEPLRDHTRLRRDASDQLLGPERGDDRGSNNRGERTGDREQPAATPQRVPAPGHGGIPNSVDDDIVPIRDLQWVLAFVVNHPVSAHCPDNLGVRSAGDARDVCAKMLRELDGRGAHATRGSNDQDSLTWLN